MTSPKLGNAGEIVSAQPYKVLLLWPSVSSSDSAVTCADYMKNVQRGLGFLPPLGLLSLASSLRAHSSFAKDSLQVEVLDANLEQLSLDQTVERVVAFRPSLLGISLLTHTWYYCSCLVRRLRESLPDMVLVAGGPHCALFPLETLEGAPFDYVIAGEGEVPLAALVERLRQGRWDTLDLPGVMRRGDALKPAFVNESLDELPVPDRSLTPWQRYSTVVTRHPPTTTLMSSRGCPYRCAFCYTAGGKTYRFMSADRLLREIESCLKLGISEFLFFDELFTMDRDRVLEFCRDLPKLCRDLGTDRPLQARWDVRARVNLVDKELLRIMAQAGCQRVQYGMESGCERTLKTLRKGITLEQSRQAAQWTREAGLNLYADFMLGAPGESREDMEETVRFACALNLDYVHFAALMLYPSTPFYLRALEEKRLPGDVWADFVHSPQAEFRPPYWPGEVPAAELEKLVQAAMRRVCLTPGFIWRRLRDADSWGQIIRQAQAAWQSLRG